MIKIDPISLKGVEELTKSLQKAVVKAAKDTAEQLRAQVESNLRTGYDDIVPGYGGTWPELSPERYYTLMMANLLPHPGLVAETQQLVDSLKMQEVGDNGFQVSVGGDIEYAFSHEFGGGRGNVPPRPFFYPAISHFKAEETPKKIIKDTIVAAVKEVQR